MTREQAMKLIAETPEYIVAPCPWCAAVTMEEAATRCRPVQLLSGDYYCGTPDEGPNSEIESGPLSQRNPAYDKLDGYLWEWSAFDAGLTTVEPVWEDAA